jgi:hypothetical protein
MSLMNFFRKVVQSSPLQPVQMRSAAITSERVHDLLKMFGFMLLHRNAFTMRVPHKIWRNHRYGNLIDNHPFGKLRPECPVNGY